jgi:hypothetical protein
MIMKPFKKQFEKVSQNLSNFFHGICGQWTFMLTLKTQTAVESILIFNHNWFPRINDTILSSYSVTFSHFLTFKLIRTCLKIKHTGNTSLH